MSKSLVYSSELKIKKNFVQILKEYDFEKFYKKDVIK